MPSYTHKPYAYLKQRASKFTPEGIKSEAMKSTPAKPMLYVDALKSEPPVHMPLPKSASMRETIQSASKSNSEPTIEAMPSLIDAHAPVLEQLREQDAEKKALAADRKATKEADKKKREALAAEREATEQAVKNKLKSEAFAARAAVLGVTFNNKRDAASSSLAEPIVQSDSTHAEEQEEEALGVEEELGVASTTMGESSSAGASTTTGGRVAHDYGGEGTVETLLQASDVIKFLNKKEKR